MSNILNRSTILLVSNFNSFCSSQVVILSPYAVNTKPVMIPYKSITIELGIEIQLFDGYNLIAYVKRKLKRNIEIIRLFI